jgi:hypothetical protein
MGTHGVEDDEGNAGGPGGDPHRPGGGPGGPGDGAGGSGNDSGGTLVAVATAGTEMDALDVRRRLDEAGIDYEENRFVPQYGFSVGTLAETTFLVLDRDAPAARVALDAAEEPEPAFEGAEEAFEDASALDGLRLDRQFRTVRILMGTMALLWAVMALIEATTLVQRLQKSGPDASLLRSVLIVTFLAVGFARATSWSRRNPAFGFGAGLLVALASVAYAFTISRFTLLPGAGIIVATFWALTAARQQAASRRPA